MSASQETSALQSVQATPATKNVNDQWKDLDAIFQAQLRQYVLTENKQKYHAIASELGFNDTQQEFLYEAIQTFTTQFRPTPNTSIPPNPPNAPNAPFYVMNNNNNNKNKNKNKNIKSSELENPLYAIPTNKNERISGQKRRRSDANTNSSLQSDVDMDFMSDDSDSDSNMSYDSEPKTKKRKIHRIQKVSTNELTQQAKQDMEADGIYIVEKIVDHQKIDENKYKYKVKWHGYQDLTWEPRDNLMKSTINKYWKSKGFKMDKEGIVHMLPAKPAKKSKKKKKVKKKSKSKSKSKSPKKHNKIKMKSAKKKDSDKEKEYKCFSCNKTFQNGYALGGHNAAKHRTKKKQEEKMMISSDESENEIDENEIDEDSQETTVSEIEKDEQDEHCEVAINLCDDEQDELIIDDSDEI